MAFFEVSVFNVNTKRFVKKDISYELNELTKTCEINEKENKIYNKRLYNERVT